MTAWAKYSTPGPAYEQAVRLPGFRSAAALRLGELLARSSDLDGAEKYLTQASSLASGVCGRAKSWSR